MQMSILIEPVEGGGFRARAGEPFALAAEGVTREEALQSLQRQIREHLRGGAQFLTINIGNGLPGSPVIASPLPDEAADEDWFWHAMQEGIEEYRKQEDAAAL